MRLYNTHTEKKEDLPVPGKDGLRLFVCGLTVYDAPHIGNARTYATFDSFVKYLRSQNIPVFYLQNVTDVDDKIIARAREQKITLAALAKKIEADYHRLEKALRINSVDKYARATKYISEIVKQIQTLLEKGYAYKIENDGYYYDISKFADYGKLAKRTAEQAEDGISRIDESVAKINKGDFALWKFKKSGDEPSWKTPLGEGRPGWHIEDTAISESFFGPQYDIHGGALDLKFPHHEAEIAQQEAASGKSPLVKIWMHAGFLLVDGKKMSKSLGNFITIEDFLKKYPANIFRYLVASHHYRSPLNYTDALAKQTRSSLKTIEEFFAKLDLITKVAPRQATPIGKQARGINILEKLEKDFLAALNDDFNTPEALAAIFSFINANQKSLWSWNEADTKSVKIKLAAMLEIFGVVISTAKIPTDIKKLVATREKFRKAKQFAESDKLRAEIESLGYKIEDTPLGPLCLHN